MTPPTAPLSPPCLRLLLHPGPSSCGPVWWDLWVPTSFMTVISMSAWLTYPFKTNPGYIWVPLQTGLDTGQTQHAAFSPRSSELTDCIHDLHGLTNIFCFDDNMFVMKFVAYTLTRNFPFGLSFKSRNAWKHNASCAMPPSACLNLPGAP